MQFQKNKIEDLLHANKAIIVFKKVRDETDQKDGYDFEMRASISGVEMFGPLTFKTEDDLQDFAKGLSDAWKAHKQMQQELKKSLVL